MLILDVLNSEFDVNLQIIMIYKNNPVVVNDVRPYFFCIKPKLLHVKFKYIL